MKIFATRKFPGSALDKLEGLGHELKVSEFDRPLSAEELLERAAGTDGILTLVTDRINGDVLDALGPQLKIISNYGVGFDNINIKDATDRGVVVANTPSDEVDEAVAEYSWALMLALSRRIVEADESTRRGAYKGWEPGVFLGTGLTGKTLGIVGLGGIGSRVAKRAAGWGMEILYNKRTRDEEVEKELGVVFADLDTLFKESDFITLHVPLTDETRHMVDKKAFEKMKKGVILVNTARGPIVDEQDLVDALRDGKLSGAGLDVFENEPNINPELIAMENVITTPHIASATREAREIMAQMTVEAAVDTFSGKMPQNIVNKDVWEKRRK